MKGSFRSPDARTYTLKEPALAAGKIARGGIDYAAELNPRQLAAVQAIDGPYLVIAGAGSGKTRTLVFRVAHLVETGVPPENILLLTFTRKSALHMMRRAAAILDHRCEKVAGGTFHSFANQVLRRYAKAAGYSDNFIILDRSDAEDIIGLIRTDMGFHRSQARFPRKGTVLGIISRAVNRSKTHEAVIESEYPQFIDHTADVIRLAEKYRDYKSERQMMDYDDLLIHLRDLLAQNTRIREDLSETYRYIMVDEFQDTNKLQAHIVSLLAAAHRNIMVVGDDAQSIYGFRGAEFENIMAFPEIFEGTEVITLEQNYRSTQPILDLTNAVISCAKKKYSKTLFTEKTGGGKPVYLEPASEPEQARFICQKVLELREEGVALNDIAVLFRNSHHANELEVELARRDIPFSKHGGFRFIETAHVKDALAYLRLALNPEDTVSLTRVLLLLEGIGTETAKRICADVHAAKDPFRQVPPAFQNKAYSPELKKIADLLAALAAASKKEVSSLLEKTIIYYTPLLKRQYDDYRKRTDDLKSLLSMAERFTDLEAFLTTLTLEPPGSQADVSPELRDEEALVLSTIHSAKGLEWHTVFIISLIDGYLPSRFSLNTETEIEEERRLLYVAATRAGQNLFLLKPNIEGGRRGYERDRYVSFTDTTRFLRELPDFGKLTQTWKLAPPRKKRRRRPAGVLEFKHTGTLPSDDVLEKINTYFNQ